MLLRHHAWRALTRAAKVLGFEPSPRLSPGEACIARLKQIRATLGGVDPASLPYLRFCLENLAVSNADIFQDLFVLHETGQKRGGFFVEFGAADGIAGSNTYALERHFGWTGIVAEPARCWHASLDGNRHCIVDHRCVTDRSGDTEIFRECRYPANSTIERYANADRFARSRRRYIRYPVPTVSLTDVLLEHGAPADFDYLSLDTEGSELMILTGFDFASFRPRIITVEHCHSPAREGLLAILSAHGYCRKHVELSGIDDWYVRA